MNSPIRARTFKSGNSEAVRLPKGLGFGIGAEVRIERDGNRVILTPVADPAEARRRLEQLIDDLQAIGRPGEVQDREEVRIEFPDRPGL